MPIAPVLEESLAPVVEPAPAPQLLVELPSRSRVFLGNLRDLVSPPRLPQLELRSAPSAFWPDVFVKRGMPWFGFFQSCAWHVAAFLLVIEIAQFFALQPTPAPRPVFNRGQVVYYSAADYLPPLDTRTAEKRRSRKLTRPNADAAEKSDPELSRQPVISLPREADNRSQTVVAPPNVKMKRDLALPNVVAWSDSTQKPRLAIPAAPLIPAAEHSRVAPQMQSSVVAPPPEIHLSTAVRTAAQQAAVIAPPPSVETASNQPLSHRNLGDLNIGHSSIIAPAPQLPVAEQGTLAKRSSPLPSASSRVVPPPPSITHSESAGSRGRLIALNLHPSVGAPPDSVAGNRRGAFAATPDGRPGATGSPGSSGTGAGSRKGNSGDLPSGLYVGNAPASGKASAVAGHAAATTAASSATIAKPHANSASAVHSESPTKLSDVEREVFADRRIYSLTLNMPNLNSAGGSWVVRFAELNQNANQGSTSEDRNLSPPVAKSKVDPGYPLQLMRENVKGTVILYAIIHADGTVSNVRVLRSVDARLDRNAKEAVAQWHFQPATKNGAPVEVEATFQIPFLPSKLNSF